MDTLQPRNKNISDQNNTRAPNREKVNQILTEFGLDPTDYIFDSSLEFATDFHSRLSEDLPKPQQSNFQTQPTITSGRPLSYVQQPPPPPPIIHRQNSKSRTSSGMSQSESLPRRTPPLPPSFPQSDANKDNATLPTEYYLNQMNSIDNPPVKVVKPSTQDLVYKKEIRIRYLQPPTPPPPAPIIIREKQLPPAPPQSPLLIRERKPEPPTPPPLTIRERPPTPPPLLEPYVIDKPIPPPPAQPRQIIIERLPTPPPKPRAVIFEKWLPYKKVKRPVLLEKAPPIEPAPPTRNVIIEYEPLKAYTVRRVIEEGIFRVDPNLYTNYNAQTDTNVRIVDRIDDLPPPSQDLLRVLKEYTDQSAPDYKAESLSTIEQLNTISNSSNAPSRPQGLVQSPGRNSLIPSPIPTPFQLSQSRRQTPVNNALYLNPEDIY